MGKLSLGFKVILVICALVMVCSGADRVYSLQSTKLPWDEARTLCQDCYTDLVTLTPENILRVQTLAKNLTSGCWVGLRKNFTSSNSSRIWSCWANGDPLLFQNWYPGWPVFEPTNTQCCSGSTTLSPEVATTAVTEFATENSTGLRSSSTDGTAFTTTTLTPEEDQCLQPTAESDDKYIEDSCVAMLSFGAWVEKNCLECLPFICYEDRFRGKANWTSRTSENATLTWESPLGNISHYQVEVKGDETRQFQTNNVTYDLVNLEAGTHYSVRVFPVKCSRKLDPQKVEFYTKPNKVENLEVTNVTETSVFLSWNKPTGGVDFYVIEDQNGKQTNSSMTSKEVGGLTPGNFYTFTVISRVGDETTKSEESSTTTYAKPGKVSNLTVSDNTVNSLHLSWVPPEGNISEFLVTALNDTNVICEEEVALKRPRTEVDLTGLPSGSVITLTVTARVNGSVEGDKVTTVDYTAPTEISDLVLETTEDSLTANWKPPEGTSTTFNVKLQLDGKTEDEVRNISEPRKVFEKLKTAANYTVIVHSFSGHLESPGVQQSKFTKPSPPTNAKVESRSKTSITFTWTAPENTATANYFVRLNSSFWKQNWTNNVIDTTSYTFVDLTPGTKYDFDVRTEAGGESSLPTPPLSHYTVAEKREISLSMLCSSDQSLLCDEKSTRDDVFQQLKEHFNETFGDSIYWELEKQ